MDPKKHRKINWKEFNEGVQRSREGGYVIRISILLPIEESFQQVRDRLYFAEPLQDVISEEDLRLVQSNDTCTCRTSYEKEYYEHETEKMRKINK